MSALFIFTFSFTFLPAKCNQVKHPSFENTMIFKSVSLKREIPSAKIKQISEQACIQNYKLVWTVSRYLFGQYDTFRDPQLCESRHGHNIHVSEHRVIHISSAASYSCKHCCFTAVLSLARCHPFQCNQYSLEVFTLCHGQGQVCLELKSHIPTACAAPELLPSLPGRRSPRMRVLSPALHTAYHANLSRRESIINRAGTHGVIQF